MDITLGEYIAKRRKRIGLTQDDLAQRLKERGQYRATSTISEWEHDERPVPVDLFEVLSEALEERSPVRLFEAAGLLTKLPGAEIVKMLDDVPTEHLRVIHSLIKTYIEATKK
jgi:transcriptional regulator with XRE-family HTH domain